MSITREQYKKKTGELQKELSTSNILAVPRLTKAVINVGLGRALQNAAHPKNLVEEIQEEIARIAGQKPVVTRARKSIASFKTREGDPLGIKVTLRGTRMYDFLDRLVHVALPRSRDFKGVPLSTVDNAGNLNIGIREHTIFPEVAESNRDVSMQATFVSTAEDTAAGIALFRALGIPLKKEDQ